MFLARKRHVLAATQSTGSLPFDGLVSTANLVSYWKLDEASGNRVDSFGNNHLTPTNNPIGAVGKIGNACKFDIASSQSLSHPDPNPLGNSDFTYTVWFKRKSVVGQFQIISKQNAYGIYVTDNPPGWVYFLIGDSTLGQVAIGAPDDTNWHFVVASYDSVAHVISLYFDNGTPSTAPTTGPITTLIDRVTIGSFGSVTDSAFFDGLIDEVGLWKRVLTSAERAALYNSGKGLSYSPSPVLTYQQAVIADGASNYWRLDETSGLSAVDLIGGKNGTISGGVTLNQSSALSDGKAMGFDGSTGSITLPTMSFPTNCSIEAWIKTTYVAAAEPVISNWLASGAGTYFGTDQGKLFVFSSIGAYGPFVADGNWHHIVYVVQGTNTTIYVDGVAYNAGASGHITTVPVSMLIANGGGGLPGDFWHGSIDEVAIYPLILTPAQIAAHYAFKAPLTYQQQIVADGAVAYWPLDETSGTVARDLAGTRNGTITGGITLNAVGVHGSKCMSFDGSGIIPISTQFPALGNAFSLEAWCNPSTLASIGNRIIMVRDLINFGDFQWITDPSTSLISLEIGFTPKWIITPVPFIINTWMHIVLTGNGTTGNVYINGAPFLTAPLVHTGGPGTSTDSRLGESWRGLLQDIAMYSLVLSPAQVANHYSLR